MRCGHALVVALVAASALAVTTDLAAQARNARSVPQAPAGTGVTDSTGVLAGQLVDASDSQPVPYGTVLLLGTERGSFADGTGTFRMVRLAPGTYVIRARQIGYAPHDTTVRVDSGPAVTTLTLRMSRIPAILKLVTIQGRRDKACVATGVPDSASDPRLFAIMTQVQENVERFRLLTQAYPFHYAREERMVLRLDPGGDLTEWVDTVTYDSRSYRPYSVGGVVPVDADTTAHAHHHMYLPTFDALGDSAFLTTHCFAYNRVEKLSSRDGPEAIRIDFRPAATITVPDVEGSVYLDAQHLVVRRAVFRLTRPDAAHPRVLGMTVTTSFGEFVPLVPVFDSVESVTRLPPGPPPAGPHSEVIRGAGPLTLGANAPVDRTLIERYRVLSDAFLTRAPGQQEAPAAPTAAASGAIAIAPPVAPAATPSTDSSTSRTPTLAGRVVQSDGTPVPGAVVGLLDTSDTVTTDDNGRFTLQAATPGAYMLSVRRLGFEPTRIAVTLSTGRIRDVTATVSRLVPVLPTVTTTAAERSAYREVGFDQRMQAGVGQFLTFDQIQQKHAPQFTELLQGMRAIRLVQRPNQFGTALVGTRLGKSGPICVSLVVDGVPQPLRDEYSATGRTLIGSESPDHLIDVSDVGAIEVYDASERPSQFGSDWCTLVVVWTRTHLRLPVVSAVRDTTSVGQPIRGRAAFGSDSSCTPPAALDTMEFGIYATLEGASSRSVPKGAWAAYVDQVLTVLDHWSVLPSELTLPSFGAPLAQSSAEASSRNGASVGQEVAPTLANVVVFTLDSTGTLTSTHIAARSLSGAADTSMLAMLQRAAVGRAFPTLPNGAGSVRFDLVVSSAEPLPGTRAAVLGRLEVPVWRLSRPAMPTGVTGDGDTSRGRRHLAAADSAVVEMVIDGQGEIVRGTVRALSATAAKDSVAGQPGYAVRIGRRLEHLQFEAARIGACRVSQLVTQSIALPRDDRAAP